MAPLIIGLFAGFFLVLGFERWSGRTEGSAARAGRSGLALLFLMTGVMHFISIEPMAKMVPPPLPPVPTVLATGVLEILGAVGLLIPRWSRTASICLFAFLVAVFPANVYAALNETGMGSHVEGTSYLWQRAPFQIFLLAWTWFFGIRRA